MYEILKKAQPKVLQILENSKKFNRLSHAYLFSGPKGSLKKEMAYLFAMMLYCKEDKPCYSCSECKAILENRHLNVFYIEPIGQSIKKEQILALQQEFSKTSLIPGSRVYIINDADTMSLSAANSLLKFIEEPTNEETYGILITRHSDNILSTIRSRSIIINFNSSNKEILKEELIHNGVDLFYSDIIAYLTNNYDEGINLLENNGFVSVANVFLKFIKILISNGPIGLFYRANMDTLYDKDNLKIFLSLVECLFRDIYELQINNKIINLVSLENDLNELSLKYSSEELLNYLKQILELQKKLGYNVNMSLLINQFLIDLKGGSI